MIADHVKTHSMLISLRHLLSKTGSVVVLCGIVCLPVDGAEIESPALSTGDRDFGPQPGMASVVGQVVYHGDAAHPWRLSRYYIKRAKTGELAEAVVALTGRNLPDPVEPHRSNVWSINQKDFQFTPETIAIRAGDRIQFLNSDPQVHNVQTTHPRHSFNVNMPAGGSHEETFDIAGGTRQPYRIGCVYHSSMRAWIFVFDHPWYHVTDPTGKFRLDNIPPGKYRLDIVHPAGELRTSHTIVLHADQTLELPVRLTPQDRTDSPR